jgi:putative FmdB family regulatory protein
MPFYEYECSKCGNGFVALRTMEDRDAPYPCPDCGEKEVDRKISTFATCDSSSGGGLPCGGSGAG